MTLISIKSILAGGFGSVILGLFCTLFISLEKVLAIMPLFIAFNGCLIGFRLVEALKDRTGQVTIFCFVMGIGGGAVAFSVVNLSGRLMNNPFGLNFTDLFVYLLLSGITSVLGAKLAVRYFNLSME